MSLKNLLRNFEVKRIVKGVYIEGPLGDTLCDEKYPDTIIPAVEVEILIGGWIKKWVYISLDTGEVLATREYSWLKDVVQRYDEDLEKWLVEEGRWFYFMPFLYPEEVISEEEIEEIKGEVREFIEKRWGDS
jgi:hypothetical protein